MSRKSLEDKVREIGNPVDMLRNAQLGPYVFPIRSEFTNWRDEQESWRNTAVFFDQSFHMTDHYMEGPDVKRLLSDVGVNTFDNFGRNKAKQIVVCNTTGTLSAIPSCSAWKIKKSISSTAPTPATGSSFTPRPGTMMFPWRWTTAA